MGHFIYKLTCKANQKIYIGASKTPTIRLKQHRAAARRGANNLLYRAMRKHGIDNFVMEVIYGSKDRKHIFEEMETYFIKLFDTYNTGYNQTNGGDGGDTTEKLSNVQKKLRGNKISKALKGVPKSNAHKSKLSVAKMGLMVGKDNPMWGRTQSDEGKARIGKAAKQRMTGRLVSESTREKLRKNATGVVFTETRRKNLSIANTGRIPWNKGKKCPSPSIETRQKMSDAHKRKSITH